MRIADIERMPPQCCRTRHALPKRANAMRHLIDAAQTGIGPAVDVCSREVVTVSARIDGSAFVAVELVPQHFCGRSQIGDEAGT